jgi:two-component system, response regulator PdtaR
LHALIIEDEVAVVDQIEQALRALGYKTFDIAFSAAEAAASASRQCPDLITADLRLVDGSGLDAVLAICAEQAIPVVFITAHGGEIVSRLPDAIVIEKPLAAASMKSAVLRAAASPLIARPSF